MKLIPINGPPFNVDYKTYITTKKAPLQLQVGSHNSGEITLKRSETKTVVLVIGDYRHWTPVCGSNNILTTMSVAVFWIDFFRTVS